MTRHHLYAFCATVGLAVGAVITWQLLRIGGSPASEYGDEALFV